MELNELKEKFSVKETDEIKVFTRNEEFVGTILPSNTGSLVIKMKSGYNIGIKTERIVKIEKLFGNLPFSEKGREEPKEEKKIMKVEGLPLISILNTGGTIASRIDYRTGAVSPALEQEKLITNIPELMETANIQTKNISEIFSEDMRFENYKKIAEEIQKEIQENKPKGIIIGHGTDTMHYTAAALSFMLENLNIPVILVGSQRSSDRGSSDAAMNLICATEFIAKTDFVGIGLCMHESSADNNCVILSGTKSRKMHSSRRDAFKPVNDIPIARINFESRKTEYLKENYPRKEEGKNLILKNEIEEKVGLLKVHPNLMPEEIEFYEKNDFKGIVIEGTGLGHAPIGSKGKTEKNKENLEAIKKLSEKAVVVMTSQAFFGRINLNVYSTGKDLLNAGVIPAEDMTPETAFIKLAWLLGNYSKEETKNLIGKNLRGEITERSDIRGFEID